MSTKKRIYIIRHGQTDYNLNGIIQGSGVNSDLNETGKKQAELFYQHFQDLPISHIITSQLKRTHQTVAPFVDAGHDYTPLSEMNEIDWGYFEGIKATRKIRDEYKKIVSEWTNGNLDYSAGGGESPNMLASRQRIGVEKMMDLTGLDDILLCSHGRAMRSLFCVLMDLPLTRMEEFEHTNLCLYEFETKDGAHFEMVRRNYTDHLQALNSFSQMTGK